MDEQIIKNFNQHIEHLEGLDVWLNHLYYDPEFSSIFNRPVLSMMITGVNYLKENLHLLKQKYQLRKA